ncbi:hypothetical protein C1645_839802 [Glomus cerebriforme]|uniref:Crinkler effector protein N-terminal domain-containing protein n=1 Tax=Glomus cerebriforme TaxID=658196 RepID=A0A397S088_9GLOM|nr:hypothetical protein C1645_839802 [Glomus cerebriforme]
MILRNAIYDKTFSSKSIDENDLILWKVNIPFDGENDKLTMLDERFDTINIEQDLEGKEMLPGDEISKYLKNFDKPPSLIHIIVQPPPLPATTEIPIKKRRIDNWVEYTTKDGLVELPPILSTMLASKKFRPAPRNEFEKLLKDVQFGQNIILPSLGQEPKNYGENYQGKSLLITEQMIEIWNMLASDRDSSTKRVLSGPVGVGKSYLALFLAAKAYAEGWLLLYVSDANKLAKPDDAEIAKEICICFLALNNDILTKDYFNQLMSLLSRSEENEEKVMQRVASNIMDDLLKQLEEKTLLVIDEHDKLFESDPPVPLKQNYYTHYLDSTQRYSTRHALASMFLPRKEGDIDRDHKGFDHWFIDLGLVYRVKF